MIGFVFTQTVADEALAAMFSAVADARQPMRDQWTKWLDARTPRELVRLNDRARSADWSCGPLGQPDEWDEVDLRQEDGLSACVASLHPSGLLRERAVRELLPRHDVRALRFLALRSSDHVEQVRGPAMRELLGRVSLEDAATCLPLLHALGSRRFGTGALDAYLGVAKARHGLALALKLMESDDVTTRREAYAIGLGEGGLDAEHIWRRLGAEVDQVSKRMLAESFASVAPMADVRTRLLAGSYVEGRVTAYYSLADKDLTRRDIHRGLLDPSARVRQAAQWRSRRTGDRPETVYLTEWEQRANSSVALGVVLNGLKETGQTLPGDVVRELVEHREPRVRLAAIRLMPSSSQDADLLLKLLHDTSPKVSKAAAERLGTATQVSYDSFDNASSSPQAWTRRAAWRARRDIGSWDRIRSDLEYLADEDQNVASLGASDLRAWLANSAATAYSTPSEAQKEAIESALAASELSEDLSRVIAFHAGVEAPKQTSRSVTSVPPESDHEAKIESRKRRSSRWPWKRK